MKQTFSYFLIAALIGSSVNALTLDKNNNVIINMEGQIHQNCIPPRGVIFKNCWPTDSDDKLTFNKNKNIVINMKGQLHPNCIPPHGVVFKNCSVWPPPN